MVPRLSSQLCGGKWQVRQKHVEFFTHAHCVPTLTPSWVLWDGPELCLDSVGLRWLCQQAWPCSVLFFSRSLPATPVFPPSLPRRLGFYSATKASDWWGDGEVKQFTDGLLSQTSRCSQLHAEEKLWRTVEMGIVWKSSKQMSSGGLEEITKIPKKGDWWLNEVWYVPFNIL